MKNQDDYELRPEYKRSDFPGGFVRGKYAGRMEEESNVVVLQPEVFEHFRNSKQVNDALLHLIKEKKAKGQ